MLTEHEHVAEVAVIGIADELKGQVPLGLIVLNSGQNNDTHDENERDRIKNNLVSLVRLKIGPWAVFKNVVFVDKLPKTRSGKILRSTMRQIANRLPYKVPATIEDHSVLDSIVNLIDPKK